MDRPDAIAAGAGGRAIGRDGARLAVAAGFLVLIAIVYRPSALALDAEWRDTIDKTYTHGYLVLLISLALMWRNRDRLQAAPLAPDRLALPLLLGLSAAWLYFWRAAIQDPQLLLLPVMLYAALLAVLGRAAARTLAFPIAYLYFAMPVWSDLVVPLQHLSIAANEILISITGLPAYMDGNLIRLPAGTLKIAEGCSGMHFFIVGLALAALHGEVARESWPLRAIFLAWMGALALVANWVRIFVIAAAAYATDMKTYLVTVDHYWFGWLVFAACFAIFLWTAERIAVRFNRVGPAQRIGREIVPDATTDWGRPSAGRCAAAGTCLALLPLLVFARDAALRAPDRVIAIHWPVVHGWSGPVRALPSLWNPVFENPSASGRRVYTDTDGRGVEIYVVVYRNQRQGAKLVEWGNSMLGDGGLGVLAERRVESPQGPWWQRLIVDSYGSRSILWTQYRIGPRRFAWPRGSQLWYGVARIWSEPISAAVAISAACARQCVGTEALVAQAAARLEPTWQATPAAPERGNR